SRGIGGCCCCVGGIGRCGFGNHQLHRQRHCQRDRQPQACPGNGAFLARGDVATSSGGGAHHASGEEQHHVHGMKHGIFHHRCAPAIAAHSQCFSALRIHLPPRDFPLIRRRIPRSPCSGGAKDAIAGG